MPRPIRSILRNACLRGLALVAGSATAATLPDAEQLKTWARDVTQTENDFARTMAERRFDRFAAFVAEDAVFQGNSPHIGRQAVLAAWKAYYEGEKAPFSWAPDRVTVSADGRSALSTGPVRDPEGRIVSRFLTLWHREGDGHWRVQADQGVDYACAPGSDH